MKLIRCLSIIVKWLIQEKIEAELEGRLEP